VNRRRGFTLIGLITIIIVSAIAIPPMMVGVSGWLDSAHQSERTEAALQLAVDLMEEILAKDFADPDDWDGETSRAEFDDVEDYDGWSSCPPKDGRGADLADFGGFTRSVSIIGVEASDLTPSVPLEPGTTDYMVVTVRVDWDGEFITLDALKVDFSDQYFENFLEE